MPRKPIEHEFRGLQTPRERVWAAVRALRTGFTTLTTQDHCRPMVPLSVVADYFDDLAQAGYLKRVHRGGRVGGRMAADVYDLVRDQFEAPRLNRGKTVTQGTGQLAMWRAMKVLGRGGFNYLDVAAAASVENFAVKPVVAKSYVNVLARAGYLQQLRASKPGTPARWRLAKDTGPHAPAITRRKCVFDRNIGVFAELETAQEVCDALPR